MSVRSAKACLSGGWSITTTRAARFAASCATGATRAWGSCKTILKSSKTRLATFASTAVARRWHFAVAEIAGAVAVLHGIAGWSWQAAWIVGGLAVIAIVEVRA